MGISVVTLAYHEADNLRLFLPEVKKYVEALNEDYEIIVIDAAETTDDSPEICEALGIRYFNQDEPGFGGAYRKAISVAEKEKFLSLDCDGAMSAEIIPQLNEAYSDDIDAVIGSRYVRGGKCDAPFSSRLMSAVLNTCFRLGIGLSVKDFSVNCRIYHTKALKQLVLTCENFEVLEEIILKLKLMKGKSFTFAEVPISVYSRNFGKSTRRLGKFILCFGRLLLKTVVMRFTYDSRKSQAENERLAERKTKIWGNLLIWLLAVLLYLMITPLCGTIPAVGKIVGMTVSYTLGLALSKSFDF